MWFVLAFKKTGAGFGKKQAAMCRKNFPFIPQLPGGQPDADLHWPSIFLLNHTSSMGVR